MKEDLLTSVPERSRRCSSCGATRSGHLKSTCGAIQGQAGVEGLMRNFNQ